MALPPGVPAARARVPLERRSLHRAGAALHAHLRAEELEPIRISVALCTFNGAAHLDDQLQSIARQTRRPHEIVICDDASVDATPEILQAFAAASHVPVRLVRNPRTVGSTKNFEKAIALCSGDVVALCDQDDVWEPHKLACLGEAFAPPRPTGMAFSDATVVDRALRAFPYTLWRSMEFTAREQRAFRSGRGLDVLLRHEVVTGATMAFRRDFTPLLLPIPPDWVHDAWIAVLLAAVTPCEPIARPLVRYRQHGDQQIGGRRRVLREQYRIARRFTADVYRDKARQFMAVRERLARSTWPLAHDDTVARVDAKISHVLAKEAMRRHALARPRLVVREAVRGHYRRYSLGWRSFACDVFL